VNAGWNKPQLLTKMKMMITLMSNYLIQWLDLHSTNVSCFLFVSF